MRLLYIIDRPNLYGSELHLLDVINYFSNDNFVKVVCFNDGPLIPLLKKNKIEISIINLNSWILTYKLYKQLKKEVESFNPDIVHCHQPKATLYGSLFCSLNNINCISTIHAFPEVFASNYKFVKKWLVHKFHYVVLFLTNAFSDKCIYVSNETAKYFNFFSNKKYVIYNWISPRFDGIKGELPQKTFNKFLCISSLVPSKGILEVINLFRTIKDFNSNARLLVIGDSNDYNYKCQIVNLISKLNLEECVSLVGYQTDLSNYYSNSDIYISLTKGESFGLSFVESMAYGLPVIASDISILHEIVPSYNLFIDYNNYNINFVKDFLLNKENLSHISIKNREWVLQQFDYIKQQDKLNKLYLDLIDNKL